MIRLLSAWSFKRPYLVTKKSLHLCVVDDIKKKHDENAGGNNGEDRHDLARKKTPQERSNPV
jgi:hypothetical protein